MYAILKVAEFYDGDTHMIPMIDDHNRLRLWPKKADAEMAIAKYERSDRADYGCPELAHNQASAWIYLVRRVDPARHIWRGANLPD